VDVKAFTQRRERNLEEEKLTRESGGRGG